MIIEEIINGNLFQSECQLWVNTINCKGRMGKGIALEFKKRFKQNFYQYEEDCENRLIRPGDVTFFNQGNNPVWIANFATKDHWKNPSQLLWIAKGLQNLILFSRVNNIKSIAIPALGCQNGGLSYKDVKRLIYERLVDLDAKIELYAPLA